MKTNFNAKLAMISILAIPTIFVMFKIISSLCALNTLLS